MLHFHLTWKLELFLFWRNWAKLKWWFSCDNWYMANYWLIVSAMLLQFIFSTVLKNKLSVSSVCYVRMVFITYRPKIKVSDLEVLGKDSSCKSYFSVVYWRIFPVWLRISRLFERLKSHPKFKSFRVFGPVYVSTREVIQRKCLMMCLSPSWHVTCRKSILYAILDSCGSLLLENSCFGGRVESQILSECIGCIVLSLLWIPKGAIVSLMKIYEKLYAGLWERVHRLLHTDFKDFLYTSRCLGRLLR